MSTTSLQKSQMKPEVLNLVKSCQNPDCEEFVVRPGNRPAKFKSLKYCSRACVRARQGKTLIERKEDRGWKPSPKTLINRRYRAKWPLKAAAHKATQRRLERGEIGRINDCSVCDSYGKIEHDHADYSKPYVTTPVCSRCHYDVEMLRRRGIRPDQAIPMAKMMRARA